MQFLRDLKRIVNTGQARTVVVTGNIHDLFFNGTDWVPLISLLNTECRAEQRLGTRGLAKVLYETHHPIEIPDETARQDLVNIWPKIHKATKSLADYMAESSDNSPLGLEILRQLTECSRHPQFKHNLLIMIENIDLLIPECEINRMSLPDRRSVAIVHDWFSDPKFVNGHDTVFLIAESVNDIHSRVTRLPQVITVEVPLPDFDTRKQFIAWYCEKEKVVIDIDPMATKTSGLSLHALNQLLRSSDYAPQAINKKIESFLSSQLGEGVVEFKRPSHSLNDLIGNTLLKQEIRREIIPAMMGNEDTALSGILVTGPNGSGKTYVFEAVAAEIDAPVIVLKNIRSKWYGETDQIFERLRRILNNFHKVIIFVDEADAQFGEIDSDQETEARLTGKIQAMMSDTELRGKVVWMLMTARPHKLSPDIRRPGRMDMIIPVLDPNEKDREEFLKWSLGEFWELVEGLNAIGTIRTLTAEYSAASFQLLRTRIKRSKPTSAANILRIISNLVMPDIADDRQYQTLQARLNCTERCVLVDESLSREDFGKLRTEWKEKIRVLESRGIG